MPNKKKVYIFYVSKEDGYDFVALAEDGTCLSPTARHVESEALARTEMLSAGMRERYGSHYPEGWDPVWRGGPINPDTMPSLAPDPKGSAAFIEGRLYQEFLRALTV
jgi:hypothetical protein